MGPAKSRAANSQAGSRPFDVIDVALENPGAGSSSQEHDKDKQSQQMSLREDLPSIAVLTLLYMFQGIPIGIAVALMGILKERGATFSQLSTFLLSSWPFSLKILWAPIVDSVYNKRFGRRKSWLVPVQLLLGIGLYVLSSCIDTWLEKGNLDITKLTGAMFCMYFLAATQDIAVDGWALTMLKATGWASICNTVGQSLGILIASTGYFLLASHGYITLPAFLAYASVAFIVATIFVALFINEGEGGGGGSSSDDAATAASSTASAAAAAAGSSSSSSRNSSRANKRQRGSDKEDTQSPFRVFGLMLKVVKLSNIQSLLVVLFTWKFAFSSESVMLLKLQETTFSKESITYLRTVISPVEMVVPLILSKYTVSSRPLDLAMWGYLPRVVLGLLACAFVAYAPSKDEVTWKFTLLVLLYMGVQTTLATAMFTSQMAFFARVSDPAIGGSYMTLLNTFANLGFLWTTTVSTRLVDIFTYKSSGSGEGKEEDVTVDGYYVTATVCAAVGVVWYFIMRNRLDGLQKFPLSAWRVHAPGRNSVKSSTSL